VKPRKETVNQIERAINLYRTVLPILESRQSDAASLEQILDGGSQVNTKVNAVKNFSNQFTTLEKDTFDTALME
jgi:hypothetical protein